MNKYGQKDFREVKQEYGYKLRWINGYGDENGTYTRGWYYLENLETQETIKIENEKAIKFIESRPSGPKAFRDGSKVYDNYVELFKILGIERKDF